MYHQNWHNMTSNKKTRNKKQGLRTAQWTEKMNVNPDELGDYFEGDIMATNDIKRNVLSDDCEYANWHWWSDGVIPIVVDGDFDEKGHEHIQQAINEFKKRTCIEFKDRTDEDNYVKISSDYSGCWSEIGRKGGEQKMNLQIPECLGKGVIIHQLMHAAGFSHEHTRSDRDNYVEINWENIQEGAKRNFKKTELNCSDFDIPYDYDSIMHSSAYAGAVHDHVKTIIPLKDPNVKIGQRERLSDLDVMKINVMYNCSSMSYNQVM
ncbi:High choriolytic enzyme 1 [Trachymyrmex septentrionalis]|uniref:Metalloendopeptidase n=1 Tax=Trachymyrmex septentrionalis TaxID=34720 RepID=A0A151JU76_9HYME|nr:High choriolytic enzyme 1 [Trachymyrmex septentrionalis]